MAPATSFTLLSWYSHTTSSTPYTTGLCSRQSPFRGPLAAQPFPATGASFLTETRWQYGPMAVITPKLSLLTNHPSQQPRAAAHSPTLSLAFGCWNSHWLSEVNKKCLLDELQPQGLTESSTQAKSQATDQHWPLLASIRSEFNL